MPPAIRLQVVRADLPKAGQVCLAVLRYRMTRNFKSVMVVVEAVRSPGCRSTATRATIAEPQPTSSNRSPTAGAASSTKSPAYGLKIV
jgi:hypothetical protein